MNPRFPLLLVVALAFAVSACTDSAMTDLQAPSPEASLATAAPSADKASCPSTTVTISGDATLEPGDTETYTASMKPGCSVNNVSWSVSGTYASYYTSGPTLYVTAAGDGTTFTVTANVVYNIDNIASGSKTVTVQNPPPAPMATTLVNNGIGHRISWTPPSGEVDYYRITRARKNLSTGVVYANEYFYTGSTYRQFNDYILNTHGNWRISYSVDAIDMNGDTIAHGGDASNAETSF